MPTVDITLEQLKLYEGTNPKPADFDAFWDEQIEKADRHLLEYEITESEISGFDTVKCYDLWFNGIDGSRIYAKYIKPIIEKKIPLILQFHGYPGASRPWFEQINFAGMGYAVLAMDCPGQGGRSEDHSGALGTTVSGHIVKGLDGPTENMYYVKTFLNTYLMSKIALLLDGIDTTRIYANGASQGAGLSLACAGLNPMISRCAILYPFLSDYQRVWDLDRDLIAYEGLRYYSRWFNQLHLNNNMFEKLGYIDVQNFAPRIKAKVLFGTGLMDTICPPSTHFAVYNKLRTEKEIHIFPDFAHEEIGEFDNQIINFFAEGGRM